MAKIYYKVVSQDLRSVVRPRVSFAVQYKIGKFVEAKVKGTPLAVFDDLVKARRFALKKKYSCIYKCEIQGKYPKPWIPWSGMFDRSMSLSDHVKHIGNLIRQKKKYSHIVDYVVPDGTVSCKRVKLLEKVS